MPSKADSKLIMNYIIIRTEISAWYVINIFLVFIVTAGTYALKYQYLGYYPDFWYIEPLLMGIWSAIMYLLFLGFILMMTEEKKVFPKKKQSYSFKNEKLQVQDETEVVEMQI